MEQEAAKPIQNWAVVELMGHQMIAGLVAEEQHFGTVMLRVDVPESEGLAAFTKFYGGGAIYGITPTTEANVRELVKRTRPRPISPYLLPDPAPRPAPGEPCGECGRPDEECQCMTEDDVPFGPRSGV